ncbi:hypothetical protein [Sphingomonas sp. ID0503]|uniref:hypothetical protein n=1 Tax=Sphingomonas sp. ID0503 TaxID=3399691 RepID=UPI003AFA4B91
MIRRSAMVVLGLLLACPAAASAAEQDPGEGTLYRLTPEEAEAAVASADTQGGVDLQPAINGADRIHGTVGAMIGTGGARGIFGAADIPLGENAGASIMFESTRYPSRRRR